METNIAIVTSIKFALLNIFMILTEVRSQVLNQKLSFNIMGTLHISLVLLDLIQFLYQKMELRYH